MSFRLLAIFPRRSETFEDVAAVPPLLAKLFPLEGAVAEAYSQRTVDPRAYRPEGWSLGPRQLSPDEQWRQFGRLDYRSSRESFLKFGRQCLILFTVAKWHFARAHPPLLAAAHRLFQVMATALKAPEFIVYHDRHSGIEDCVYSGLSIEQVGREIVAGGALRASHMKDLHLTGVQLEPAAKVPDLYYEEVVSQ